MIQLTRNAGTSLTLTWIIIELRVHILCLCQTRLSLGQEFRPDHVSGALEERIKEDVMADVRKIRAIKLQECKDRVSQLSRSWTATSEPWHMFPRRTLILHTSSSESESELHTFRFLEENSGLDFDQFNSIQSIWSTWVRSVWEAQESYVEHQHHWNNEKLNKTLQSQHSMRTWTGSHRMSLTGCGLGRLFCEAGVSLG